MANPGLKIQLTKSILTLVSFINNPKLTRPFKISLTNKTIIYPLIPCIGSKK